MSEESYEPGFRLKQTGSRIDLGKLSDEFLTAICNMITNLTPKDPEAAIAFLGYALGGLQIDDLRERLVVFPNDSPVVPSRETVRRILIRGCRAVFDEYRKIAGCDNFQVSALYDNIVETMIWSTSKHNDIPIPPEEENDDSKRTEGEAAHEEAL